MSMLNSRGTPKFIGLDSAVKDGFLKSDLVYSIIKKKAATGARAPFNVYSIRSLKAYKDYHEYLTQKDINLKELENLKQNAIEPKKHYLNDKFLNPNDELSGTEYTEALLTYLNLTGNTFEQAIRKSKRGEILELHPMPPQYVRVKTDGKYPVKATGYTLQFDHEMPFEKEEVIHTKYFNPLFNQNGSHLLGISPIQVAWDLITADDEGYKAMAEQRMNRGARKIIAIENDKIRDYGEGKQMMQGLTDVFNNRAHVDFKDKLMPIWGKASMLDVGLTAKDMEILQSGQVTFDRLSNIFMVPVEWFNSDKQSKYNNLEQYNKQAILTGVIPDLNKIRDSRNRWARKYGVISSGEAIEADYTVFTELEIDKKTVWEWVKEAPFTPNEKRVFLGENASKGEGMDTVFINKNMIPVDMAGKVNILNSTNDDNTNSEGQENEGGNNEGFGGEES